MASRKPKETRRNEVALAALKIIAEYGLREFTAARLAQEVGIKDASIFRHFNDMSEVMRAALDKLEESLKPPASTGGHPLEQLEAFILSRFRLVSMQPGIQSILFSDQISHVLGDEGSRRITALRNRGRKFIVDQLREASEQGIIRGDLDIEVLVTVVTGLVVGFLLAVKDEAFSLSIESMEVRIWQTFRSMIEKKE